MQQMRGLGPDIDLEGARSLLATVTGDDFVAMCVVLDNVRGLTLQLQELTDESGEFLRGQAAEIQTRNDKLQVALRDAENTFDTVSLSSQVAAILQEGQRNFAAPLSLELPPLRGFDSAELQQEFERLTQEMSGIQ